MNFETVFAHWVDACMQQDIPDTVVGYSFNLYEPAGEAGVKFGIELIGAGAFDKDNPDWACEEVWVPTERGISIPGEYSGAEWKKCLKQMKALVNKHLDGNSPSAKILKSCKGIGIGFVDGDLEVIWTS